MSLECGGRRSLLEVEICMGALVERFLVLDGRMGGCSKDEGAKLFCVLRNWRRAMAMKNW